MKNSKKNINMKRVERIQILSRKSRVQMGQKLGKSRGLSFLNSFEGRRDSKFSRNTKIVLVLPYDCE